MARKAGPRTTTKVRPDGDLKKRFPNGISSTILAVQYYWHELKNNGQAGLTPEKFCDEAGFRKVYQDIVDLYPGIRKKANPAEGDGLARMIHRLANGTQDIEFFQLRAFAQYVGLPTGLFLLFTQMVSDERRSIEQHRDPHEASLKLLGQVRKAIEAAETCIENNRNELRIFTHAYDEVGAKQMAKARTLKVWSDAFQL